MISVAEPGRWGDNPPMKFSLAGVVTLLAVLVCSCAPEHPKAAAHVPVIGFSQDSLVLERWKRDIEAFQRAAKDLGAQVILKVADQDASVQEDQVRELVREGIDVLVIVTNDSDRLSEVVREVKRRGIPVISYDRLVRKAGVDLYISFDNEKVGSLMTSSILSDIDQGGFLIINGARTDNNALMINTGIHAVLKPSLDSGKIHLVSEIWPVAWDTAEVRAALEPLLPRIGEIRGIVAGDDMLAEEAIRFFSENGRTGLVRVAGQDADLAACQRIAEGTQLATVYKPVERLALKAAGFAVMLANHEPIQTDATIDDGTSNVPYVRLEPILVSRSNLDATVIKDGFHSAKEVYQNLAGRN
jgi:D-xylose transport system substrate-binding protein